MITNARKRRSTRGVPVTALFDSPEAVEQALARLNALGLPRDLVEVAVRPAGADRFYGGRGRKRQRDTYRFAAIGGLIGLIQGTVVSLILVAMPGFLDPGVMAWAQLLGPNLGAILGATVGAVYGLFIRRKPESWHMRLNEGENVILVAALVQNKDRIESIARLMTENGGREVRAGVPEA